MRILYLEGDECSPKYVANTLDSLGFEVDRVVGRRYNGVFDLHDVVLLSDYPGSLLGPDGQPRLLESLEAGAGLVFVGGWTSFGRAGYAHGALAKALPVRLKDGDDRQNVPMGLFPRPAHAHPLVDGLPWDHAPVLTGHNRVEPKPDAEVVLEGYRVVGLERDAARLAAEDPVPLLVCGRYGNGRIVAFAGDLAPHWSGGLTDWGPGRLDVGEGEEVGGSYRAFLERLCRYAAGEEPRPAEGGARADLSRRS